MPRNVLAGKTNDELAMTYIIRLMDRNYSPTKLFSTADLWEELRKRLSHEDAEALIEQAKKTHSLLGED